MSSFDRTGVTASEPLGAVREELARLQLERRKHEESISRINLELESLTRSVNLAASRALRHAALHGDLAELQSCLAVPADLNARNRAGATALLLAVQRDDNHLAVRALLDAGADPNKPDFDGTTPLIAAVRPGQLETVRALVEHGASVNIRNRDGDSPLTNAAMWGSADVVRYLLDHGADADLVDGVGLTAAQLARQQEHLAIADMIETAAKNIS